MTTLCQIEHQAMAQRGHDEVKYHNLETAFHQQTKKMHDEVGIHNQPLVNSEHQNSRLVELGAQEEQQLRPEREEAKSLHTGIAKAQLEAITVQSEYVSALTKNDKLMLQNGEMLQEYNEECHQHNETWELYQHSLSAPPVAPGLPDATTARLRTATDGRLPYRSTDEEDGRLWIEMKRRSQG